MGIRTFSILSFLLALSSPALAGQDDYTAGLDRAFYRPGEAIGLKIENRTSDSITIWMEIKKGREEIARDEAEWEVEAHKTWTWKWNRTDGYGTKVTLAPGSYRLVVTYHVSQPHVPTDEDYRVDRIVYPFDVIRTNGDGLLVRTTKAKYAKGEKVQTYVLNQFRSQEVKLPSTNPWSIYQRAAHANGGNAEYRKIVHTVQLPGAVTIPAEGGRELWNWNQKNQQGEKVTVGKYSVQVTLLRGVRDQKTIYERFFSIVK